MGASVRLVVFDRRGTLIACDRKSGHRKRLNVVTRVSGEAPGDILVEGRFVAFPYVDSDDDGRIRSFMRIVNGTRGGDRTQAPLYSGAQWRHRPGDSQPAGFELSADGDVAWIVEAAQPGSLEVRYLPRRGEVRLLEGSETINRNSLAVGDRFVYWRSGGVPRSAPR